MARPRELASRCLTSSEAEPRVPGRRPARSAASRGSWLTLVGNLAILLISFPSPSSLVQSDSLAARRAGGVFPWQGSGLDGDDSGCWGSVITPYAEVLGGGKRNAKVYFAFPRSRPGESSM